LAVRAVTVQALDERAASFYRHFGFQPTELAPMTLMVPLYTVRDVLPPHARLPTPPSLPSS
ncbi:MAG TPA: hypothetical protein VMG62_02485, partial [Solirubrobacteraceae bacterium]|nr:hypothetical protein [Solirubrobacteraceae bacterium]